MFPDDPFNYDCTPKPSIEIHTLKLLQKNVLQSPNKILGCSTFHIIFKGLQEYKISEGPLERSPIWMPERPIVIIGAIYAQTVSKYTGPLYPTISYDFQDLRTLLPVTMELKIPPALGRNSRRKSFFHLSNSKTLQQNRLVQQVASVYHSIVVECVCLTKMNWFLDGKRWITLSSHS